MQDELINPQNLSLSAQQLAMLMPYLAISLGAMATLLVGVAFSANNKAAALVMSLITIAVAFASSYTLLNEPAVALFGGMLASDGYSSIFNLLLTGASGLVILASYSYLEKEGINYAEYYSLVLFSCLGMMLLASSLDLIVLFVSLEIMSIGVYVLVGFRRTDVKSNEAALKYFILGSAASAIMLFGVALLYGATGTMNLNEIYAAVKNTGGTPNSLLVIGAALVLIGFLFKVAMVPFHMWMPDVYEGAPTSVTNLMTTGLKAAAFAAFMRVFVGLGATDLSTGFIATSFHNIIWVVAAVTMFIGNVIALTQRNIKRMLAYSSIAHSGYIAVGFLASGRSEYGFASIIVYLVGYVVMNIGAFTIVSIIGERGDRNTDIQDYSGLGFRHPVLGFGMAVFMFSMAGVPPTVGFAGKYMIFSSAVQAGETPLAILAVLCSAISAYYYLRVIVYMYMKNAVRESPLALSIPAAFVVAIAVLAVLGFGAYPAPLIEAAKKAIGV